MIPDERSLVVKNEDICGIKSQGISADCGIKSQGISASIQNQDLSNTVKQTVWNHF
jgi:hypothetical protein